MDNLVDIYELSGQFLKQPLGEFFVGVIPASVLRKIAAADIRRLEEKSGERNIGLERPLNPNRVAEIKRYISTVDATFPNSIIVVINSENVISVDKENSRIVIKCHDQVAKLIDGLHRLAGFDESNWSHFDLIVSVFFDLSDEDQATIFSTINLKQTKVTKSLVYDLFDLATTRSPYKTCHDITKALNHDEQSPFYRRIKLLGVNPKWNDEVVYRGVLTQGTFVERLLKLIGTPTLIVDDRDKLKRGQPIERFPNELELGFIFRDFFAREQDDAILKIMLNYFNGVKKTFPAEWQDYSNPLSRTIGYGALMRLLVDLYRIGFATKSLSEKLFIEYLSKAKGIDLTFYKYSPSGSGETDLYNDLKHMVLGNA